MPALDFSNMLPNINIPQLASGLGGALQVVLILIFIGILTFIAFKKKWVYKFPTKFLIYRVMGGTLKSVGEDQGRRVIKRKNGRIIDFYYDIKNANFKWYPPSYEFMTAGDKGKAVVHVREISHNNWETFDPANLVKGNPLEYRTAEKNELDDYFKNTQDDAAEIKFIMDKDKWQRVIDVLPVFMLLLGVGLAISFALGPLGELYAATVGQNDALLQRSVDVLDKTNTLFDAAMRFCGQSQECLRNLGLEANITVVGNETIIG